jgi:hypothetical protein
MVPRYARHAESHVSVVVKGPHVTTDSSSTLEPYVISWKDVAPEPIFSNETVYIKREKFILPAGQTTQTDEGGHPVAPTTLIAR